MTIKHHKQPSEDVHAATLWGRRPLRVRHSLHLLSTFTRSGVAELIDRYPLSRCSLIDIKKANGRRFQREGTFSGEAVVDAIEQGRMWLQLRELDEVDGACFKITERLLQEISSLNPAFSPIQFSSDLSVSSPGVQIGYRSDPRGQLLWQIAGRRRVYVWPPSAPFVTPRYLEDAALVGTQEVIPYARWYDAHATMVKLEPGQMLTWPLNAPYRIENLDGLNVSMTVSFDDHDSDRLRHVNVANGLLRQWFGYAAKSRSIYGPAYWSKAVFQKIVKTAVARCEPRSTERCADFRLDAANPGAIADLTAAR